MKKILLLTLCLVAFASQAQLLFSENFVLILDSTRRFKGSVLPSVEIKKQRRTYVELNNAVDFSYKLKRHSISMANKFELTKDGPNILLSGGYLYFKLKTLNDHSIVPEYYAQYQWAEARGLDQKYAVGANLRYKVYKDSKGGFFIGLGSFYEYELWDYRGVPDDRLNENSLGELENKNLKANGYVSFRQIFGDRITLISALYYQSEFEKLFRTPRLAGSFSVRYKFTEHISFSTNYRLIYDYAPIVPIDKYWYNFFSSIELTF